MKSTTPLLASAVALFGCNSAMAVDFGFFGAIEGGDTDLSFDSVPGEFEFDVSRARIGFSLDTAANGDGVFSYRLGVGLERLDLEDDVGDTLELTGISADNTFTFRLHKSENVKLWAGPRVRVGAYEGDLDSDSSIEATLVEFGLGGVIGLNFQTSGAANIGLELGVMASGYAGELEVFGVTDDFDGDGTSVFLTGVVVF